ncbi:hypothetical protein A6V39_02305 [Candidatus Mycoplasma haematobovis]|uniref:Uncharacterized protein n=1 Tax=Candidatus Mycoplasma haematobovis TaxID=432608 RepID=A0A1A9QDS4_9MOLU|nr:hypothetical protein [Candidatus Mycoplasma haematobovis]OAL10254.1 hypothetical protein A6V39_02305 [Candidatus Mycoplasma haematobovis]
MISRFQRTLVRKLRTIKLRIIYSLKKIKVVAFYLSRKRAKAEYTEIVSKNCIHALEKILEGTGGVKNIAKVKSTQSNCKIWVKFKPLLNREALEKSGGIGLEIDEKLISLTFCSVECKDISKSIKVEMDRQQLVPLDME